MRRTLFPDYPSVMPTLQFRANAHLTSLWTAAPGEVLDLFDRDRERLRAWCPWVDGCRSLESLQEVMAAARRDFDEQKALWFVIRHRDAVVGVMGLYDLRASDRRGSIACMVEEAHEGLGLVYDAGAALTCYGMDALGLIRIEAQTAAENRRGIKTMERLGFRREGVLRCAQWLHDHPVDNVVYSLTAQDPRPRRIG